MLKSQSLDSINVYKFNFWGIICYQEQQKNPTPLAPKLKWENSITPLTEVCEDEVTHLYKISSRIMLKQCTLFIYLTGQSRQTNIFAYYRNNQGSAKECP